MLGRFSKLNNEMEFFRLKNQRPPEPPPIPPEFNVDISISCGKFNDSQEWQPLPNIQIKVYYKKDLILSGETNENGILEGNIPYYPSGEYKFIVSGNDIVTETLFIPHDTIREGIIDILPRLQPPYLALKPEYLWLNPQNQNKGDVDVTSNVDWNIS